MAWTTGRDLPANWPAIRNQVKARDGHRCTAIREDGNRCPETTRLEVDHIGDPDDHSPRRNLRTLCHWHHARRTATQSHAARQANKAQEQHPGLTA